MSWVLLTSVGCTSRDATRCFCCIGCVGCNAGCIQLHAHSMQPARRSGVPGVQLESESRALLDRRVEHVEHERARRAAYADFDAARHPDEVTLAAIFRFRAGF